MSLAIDIIGTNLKSATRIYNINFCIYLSKRDLKKTIYIFLVKDYFDILKKYKNPKIKYIVKSNIYSKILPRLIWMQFLLPIELKILKVKELFSPMNFGPLLLKWMKIKLILGLHSNLPWKYFKKMPGTYFKKIFTKFLMERSIANADLLIVQSNTARNEILNLLSLNSNKVKKIYPGINRSFFKSNNRNNLKNFDYKDYFLNISSTVKYHNILNVLKAYKKFKAKKINLRFVFVTQVLDKSYFSQIQSYIKQNLNKKDVIIFKNLDQKYLINLYKNAKFYIFTSYCEVFGMTPVEAMINKCPVLISKTSSLKEVNNDAALYFNPDKIDSIYNSMSEISRNNKLAKKLIKKGIKNSRRYSWKKTVEKTCKYLAC